MKDLFNIALGKLNRNNLKFYYLRIGKAGALLDNLREHSEEIEAKWEQHEADSFNEIYFGANLEEYDGMILNLGVTDENIAEIRRDFWDNFIWETQETPLPLALVVPDMTSFGSLSRSQLIESLSLIRLTDRPYEIFENREEDIDEIIQFLTGISSVIHRKERQPEEQEEV